MKRVLVTGFEPFLGSSVNPSRELIRALTHESSLKDCIIPLVLPVSYRRSFPLLQSAWEAFEGGAILMFGQAGGRPKISLERVALNWWESALPDEDGQRPATGPISEGEPGASFCELPLDVWRDELEAIGIPCEVSLSAGGFVCNHLYHHVRRAMKDVPVLFVHLPFLPEQAAGGKPSLDLAKMEQAARLLIQKMKTIGAERATV